jgi:hypothetical protein
MKEYGYLGKYILEVKVFDDLKTETCLEDSKIVTVPVKLIWDGKEYRGKYIAEIYEPNTIMGRKFDWQTGDVVAIEDFNFWYDIYDKAEEYILEAIGIENPR